MTYLGTEVELAALRAMPLESAFRGAPFDRVVKRLLEERSLADGGHLPNSKNELAVVVLVQGETDHALRTSVESVALQSLGDTPCVLVAQDLAEKDKIEAFVAGLTLKPRATRVVVGLGSAERKSLCKQRMVTFVRHGDRLHPSAAAAIAIARVRERATSVVCWGELQPSADGTKLLWAQRNPALSRRALEHWPYLRNAFAVATDWLAQYPGDIVREALRNHLHLFQLWLLHKPDVLWSGIHELFLIRANQRASEKLEHAARAAFADYAEAYAQAQQVRGYSLSLQPSESPAPYRLRPPSTPSVVSVIIPFRDKPDLTVAAAKSVLSQRFSGYLEILLVDNQSTSDSLSKVRATLASELASGRCRLLTYDKPFNHSAQCNLGVAESLGDVIVFFNNDASLRTPEAIEEMAAWAAEPGTGTVGVRMVNPDNRHEAAGMTLRLQPTAYFDSIVEESSHAAFTPYVREVFGNTFACAAMSRATFEAAGRLDPVAFPNGYNDVDFACRANRLGLSSLVLGHLVATHAPGASRGRVDEVAQKGLLRGLYPETGAMALIQLGMDAVLLERARPVAADPRLAGVVAPTESIKEETTVTPANAPPRPFLKRVAGRIAASGPVQRMLRNPTVYRLAQKTYRLILR